MEMKACCFIGHRKVIEPEKIKERLKIIVTELLHQDYSVFYFGSKSCFDDIALKVVTNLKKEYPLIKRVYVRSMYSEVDELYKNYLLESYEDTYMPDGIENAGRASYVERNQSMINVSDCCVFYYLENYSPAQIKQSKRDLIGESDGARTKAISDLIQLIRVIPMDGKQGYDVLGFIYEYLISMFAANAGKKAGEFYTPHEVSLLMSEIVAEHLKDREKIEIYDPTSGSGSLLINIGHSVAKRMKNKNDIKYYAQELKENTYNLTRMNLIMRGILPDNICTRKRSLS